VKNKEVFGYIDSVVSIKAAIEKYGYQKSIKISGKLDEVLKLSIGVRNDDETLFYIFSKALESISDIEKEEIVNNEIKILHHDSVDYSLIWKMLLLFGMVVGGLIWAYKKLSDTNEKLQESVKNFELLLNNTRDVIMVWDRDFHILLINKAGEDIFGYSAQEIAGTSVMEFVDASRKDVVEWIMENDSKISFEMVL